MEILCAVLFVVVLILGWVLLQVKKDEGADEKEIEVLLDEKTIIAENKKKVWKNQDAINKHSADELNKLRRTWTRKD